MFRAQHKLTMNKFVISLFRNFERCALAALKRIESRSFFRSLTPYLYLSVCVCYTDECGRVSARTQALHICSTATTTKSSTTTTTTACMEKIYFLFHVRFIFWKETTSDNRLSWYSHYFNKNRWAQIHASLLTLNLMYKLNVCHDVQFTFISTNEYV